VANSQSFNSYLAEGVGCTTFSFGLNLGIYIRAIPHTHLFPGVDPSVKPAEYHCHFRKHLLKSIDQPTLPRRDVWYIDPDGRNLADVVSDARSVLVADGLPWFARLDSLHDVFDMLIEDVPSELAIGPGIGSPNWKYFTGHIARQLGKREMADGLIAEAEAAYKEIHSKYLSPRRAP